MPEETTAAVNGAPKCANPGHAAKTRTTTWRRTCCRHKPEHHHRGLLRRDHGLGRLTGAYTPSPGPIASPPGAGESSSRDRASTSGVTTAISPWVAPAGSPGVAPLSSGSRTGYTASRDRQCKTQSKHRRRRRQCAQQGSTGGKKPGHAYGCRKQGGRVPQRKYAKMSFTLRRSMAGSSASGKIGASFFSIMGACHLGSSEAQHLASRTTGNINAWDHRSVNV